MSMSARQTEGNGYNSKYDWPEGKDTDILDLSNVVDAPQINKITNSTLISIRMSSWHKKKKSYEQ